MSAKADATRVRMTLSDRQRLAWLRLYRSENVGPATFRDLINHCGSAETALEMLPHLAGRGGRKRSISIHPLEDAERELEAVTRFGAKIIAIGEPGYPPIMARTELAPPLLTVKGHLPALCEPTVSIVGARNASMTGIKLTRMIARDLGQAGHVIVSGFARGIDRAAHEASLETGTVAALAGGIDKPYPPENADILERIISGDTSCLMTDRPFGHEPKSRDFPRRNRLIAAMSLGLVVVEAAQRSGSLITARMAGEMGRALFAVPGSPLDPRSAGTNGLIREGATLVTGAADILEGLRPLDRRQPPAQQPNLFEAPDEMTLPPNDDERSAIISLLGPSPSDIDEIIAHTGLKPAQVMLVILELDLANRIERHSGNRVSLLDLDA